MKTVIYLDVLLGVNLLIAWCLLCATAWLTNSSVNRVRICVASILASLSTLMLIAPTMSIPMQILTKFGAAVCIVAVAFPHTTPVMLIKHSVWFFLLNFLLAGVVFAVVSFGHGQAMETNNLAVYFNISPQVLIFSVLVVWLVLKLAEYLFTPPFQEVIVTLQMQIQNKKICMNAMGDTGCSIRDPLTGQKVVLVSFQAAKEQLPDQIVDAAKKYFETGIPDEKGRLWLISCQTAGGDMLIPACSAGGLVLQYGKKTVKEPFVTVGITKESFRHGQYKAIVGTDWIQQLV